MSLCDRQSLLKSIFVAGHELKYSLYLKYFRKCSMTILRGSVASKLYTLQIKFCLSVGSAVGWSAESNSEDSF